MPISLNWLLFSDNVSFSAKYNLLYCWSDESLSDSGEDRLDTYLPFLEYFRNYFILINFKSNFGQLF